MSTLRENYHRAVMLQVEKLGCMQKNHASGLQFAPLYICV